MAVIHRVDLTSRRGSPLVWLACLRRGPLPGFWLGCSGRHMPPHQAVTCSRVHLAPSLAYHLVLICHDSTKGHALESSVGLASLFESSNSARWRGAHTESQLTDGGNLVRTSRLEQCSRHTLRTRPCRTSTLSTRFEAPRRGMSLDRASHWALFTMLEVAKWSRSHGSWGGVWKRSRT